MDYDLIKEIEDNLELGKVSFEDFEELEEIVTPGSGTGCNCNASPTSP